MFFFKGLYTMHIPTKLSEGMPIWPRWKCRKITITSGGIKYQEKFHIRAYNDSYIIGFFNLTLFLINIDITFFGYTCLGRHLCSLFHRNKFVFISEKLWFSCKMKSKSWSKYYQTVVWDVIVWILNIWTRINSNIVFGITGMFILYRLTYQIPQL